MDWLPLITALIVLVAGFAIQRQLFRSALRKDLREQKLSLLRQCSAELISLLGRVTSEFIDLHRNYQSAAQKISNEIWDEVASDDEMAPRLELELAKLYPERREANRLFFQLQERRNMVDLLLPPDSPGKNDLMLEIDAAIELAGAVEGEDQSSEIGQHCARIRELARAVLDHMEKSYLDSL